MPKDSIPLSAPKVSGNEWEYVKECLDAEWVSSAGKYVNLFDEKISVYTGSKYSVAYANGTSALQVSLRLAGVQPGDEVIAPTLTFIAPVNVITYNGAEPVFMDADGYYNIDSGKTIEFIESSPESYRTIFDEATSSLDNETEQSVMEAIEGLSKDLTLIIIAHHLTTLKNCTQIVELSNGGVKCTGSYQDIVNQSAVAPQKNKDNQIHGN